MLHLNSINNFLTLHFPQDTKISPLLRRDVTWGIQKVKLGNLSKRGLRICKKGKMESS